VEPREIEDEDVDAEQRQRGRHLRLDDAILVLELEECRGDDVEVGAGARINRAVLADKVKIGANDVIENAVVVPRRLVEGKKPPEKALPGHFHGENFIVPL